MVHSSQDIICWFMNFLEIIQKLLMDFFRESDDRIWAKVTTYACTQKDSGRVTGFEVLKLNIL